MLRFADLIDNLAYTPSRNGKLRLIEVYLRETPDPDRGYALAALTGDLDIKSVKPALIRALVSERVDPVLFGHSYDFVGDLAETIALIWPVIDPVRANSDLPLSDVIATVEGASKTEAPKLLTTLLDRLPPSARYVLIKLVTGALRIGISGRLARQALANLGAHSIEDIEEIWHGLEPPYTALFAWIEGMGEKPVARAFVPFRPVMLAHPLDESELPNLNPAEFAAEWKWDGIRVQAVASNGERRLYSRTGDDISAAFPDVLDYLEFDGSIDGELLVARSGAHGNPQIGTFADLQQRLNRKTVTKPLAASHPAFIRAYDVLEAEGEDMRPQAYHVRRSRLSGMVRKLDPSRFDLSPELEFSTWEELATLRAAPPHPVIEGVMLKRRDSPYLAGRVKGPWFKWKRDPHVIDAVLIYAQRASREAFRLLF